MGVSGPRQSVSVDSLHNRPFHVGNVLEDGNGGAYPALGTAVIGAQYPCLPMMNADEDALSAARPRVAVWIDRLRRTGHVVCVRKHNMGSGAKPNAGFRIDVDGRTMTVWELWARFRSELGDGKPLHGASLGAASRTHHRRR